MLKEQFVGGAKKNALKTTLIGLATLAATSGLPAQSKEVTQKETPEAGYENFKERLQKMVDEALVVENNVLYLKSNKFTNVLILLEDIYGDNTENSEGFSILSNMITSTFLKQSSWSSVEITDDDSRPDSASGKSWQKLVKKIVQAKDSPEQHGELIAKMLITPYREYIKD